MRMKIKTFPILRAITLLAPAVYGSESFYTARMEDPDAVYLTRDGFPVHADGVEDDSVALQTAIDKVAATSNGGVLFIPEGTYRIGKTVYVWRGIRLIGYGRNRPLFLLGRNTPGFQEGEGKYMLFFSGGRGRDGGPPRDGGAGTFYGAISNIDIRIEAGNPAAVRFGCIGRWRQGRETCRRFFEHCRRGGEQQRRALFHRCPQTRCLSVG